MRFSIVDCSSRIARRTISSTGSRRVVSAPRQSVRGVLEGPLPPSLAFHGAHLPQTWAAKAWLELFFDLIFIVALRDVGEILSEAHDGHIAPQQFLHFVLVFLPVWWIWAGHTIYAHRFDTDNEDGIFETYGGFAAKRPLFPGDGKRLQLRTMQASGGSRPANCRHRVSVTRSRRVAARHRAAALAAVACRHEAKKRRGGLATGCNLRANL